MTYAKLLEGKVFFATRKILNGTNVVYNPSAAMLTEQGYKPVIFTEALEAEQGCVAVPGWTETEEAIIQSWTMEPEGDVSDAEALDILLGGEDQ